MPLPLLRSPAASPPELRRSTSSVELVRAVQQLQLREYWRRTGLLAFAIVVGGVTAAGWIGVAHPAMARFLLGGSLLCALAMVVGIALGQRKSQRGALDSVARRVGNAVPGLQFDLLAAIELSRSVDYGEFSPRLAHEFLRSVDERSGPVTAAALVKRPSWYGIPLALALLALAAALAFGGARVKTGLAKVLVTSTAPPLAVRSPISGDFRFTYHYPEYTGLEVRSVEGSTGDVNAPTGTVVDVRTRADRPVKQAELVIDGDATAMVVEGRTLSARFTVKKTGAYHITFLNGKRTVAVGPDMPIVAQPDTVPKVHLQSPLGEVELDPASQQVRLKYDAEDDYGLTEIALVYRTEGGAPERVKLSTGGERNARGEYAWSLNALKLEPGQVVTAFVEATDNDAVAGPKKGVSASLKVTLYSAEAHRREALAKTQVLWDALVTHLADRMESPDRHPPATVDAARAGMPIDTRAQVLAANLQELGTTLKADKGAPRALAFALTNVASQLREDTSAIAKHRHSWLQPRPSTTDTRRLGELIESDVAHAESSVLYLEALLDRQKVEAVEALARELKGHWRDMQQMLQELDRTKDATVKEALLKDLDRLQLKMAELSRRMAELSRGIRDEFINSDALKEMMAAEKLGGNLDDLKQLIRDGKTSDAMKHLQALAMQMDSLLDGLNAAGGQAGQQMDPKLANDFRNLKQSVDSLVEKQNSIAQRTERMRAKERASQKQRIGTQGEKLKRSIESELESLRKSWSDLTPPRRGFRLDMAQEDGLRRIDEVKQALEADDFDLAAESSLGLTERAQDLAEGASQQARLEQLMPTDPHATQNANKTADRLKGDARTADHIAQKLNSLFTPQSPNAADRQALEKLSKEQQGLAQEGRQMAQQMRGLRERAPLFDETALEEAGRAADKMEGAGQRLRQHDAPGGYAQQRGALKMLEGMKKSMEAGGKQPGGLRSLPGPMMRGDDGLGQEHVEIPPEEPNRASQEVRKDILQMMKQGAPDRYREPNKKYYEELVK